MKIVLVGAVSFAAGFWAAAVFAAHNHNQELDDIKEYYKEKTDAAIEEYRRTYEAARGPVEPEEPHEVEIEGTTYEMVERIGGEEKEEAQEVTVEAAQALIETQGYTAYNKVAEKPRPPKIDTPAITEVPVKITFEEFDLTPPGFEQYTLTYYEGNNTLVSQAGKVIKGKDRVRTVGDLLGTFEDGKDAIYVRNPKLKMDFEVVRDPHGFTDVDGDE